MKEASFSPNTIETNNINNITSSIIEFEPIGFIQSEFKAKSTIPRQTNLVPQVKSAIALPFVTETRQWVRGLEEFSHIWIIFYFNKNGDNRRRPVVKVPPGRLVNERLGCLSTRSPYRPNPIGISAVELLNIEYTTHEILLHYAGGDMLDKTPVLDIKPYIPYVDAIEQAQGAWANEPPQKLLRVIWREVALVSLQRLLIDDFERIFDVITNLLEHDPRPFHYRFFNKLKNDRKANLWSFEYSRIKIFYTVIEDLAEVIRVEAL
jgi:tRNA-Thr(GGU) m(6)t(6)A37 methyltransferase TsaA